ncbi:hypothetical protein ACFSTH_15030 [Paenibacillus yanchengensis]|uniref:Uncharacterized protein n=1 Tax=Paenibacillus yanchengensis TaxID=2035833 RepID=A0ABW4YHU3_9BACL
MQEVIVIGFEEDESARMLYGIELLQRKLTELGYMVQLRAGGWDGDGYRYSSERKIYVGRRYSSELINSLEEREVLLYHTSPPVQEGFYLTTCSGKLTVIVAEEDSGLLYGCQELVNIISEQGSLPFNIVRADGPRFVWRGAAIGLQQSKIEEGKGNFEYPLTPDRFPWFYDKPMWTKYLDHLLEQRANRLSLWNAHPFSSLVYLEEEPEALEVSKRQLVINREMLSWLIEQAEKRNIKVLFSFYNIHIPHAFADKYNLTYTQTHPLPVTSMYTSRLIRLFVKDFPTVGFMISLGEKLKGQIYGEEWLCETILPSIKQGWLQSGAAALPEVVLRSHGSQIEKVLQKADKIYPNIISEKKYTGESITTWVPRGTTQQTHQRLSTREAGHIATIHMNTNLEPFRFGAVSAIQRMVQSMEHRLGTNAIQFYPLNYWNWPYSLDRVEIPLLQIERDWMWHEAWLRYAWNPDRDATSEKRYWVSKLAMQFGNEEAAELVLSAYEDAGNCAPRLLRRFGITQGTRQTFSLGMTMSQLINPERYFPWKELWESHAPYGERLEEYVIKALAGMNHSGETPLNAVEEAEVFMEDAMRKIKQADSFVCHNRLEYERIVSDMEALQALVDAYTYKVRASLLILMYKHTVEKSYFEKLELLEESVEWLEKSVERYRELTNITKETYTYAGSLHTRHRKIPFRDGAIFNHWQHCLPLFEEELEIFKKRIAKLQSNKVPRKVSDAEAEIWTKYQRYHQVSFELLSANAEVYTIEKGARVFTDGDIPIVECAEEIYGLTGVRFNQVDAVYEDMKIEMKLHADAYILVGIFFSEDMQWLKAPTEQLPYIANKKFELLVQKGVLLFSYPAVHIYAVPYKAGRHVLQFGKGAFTILGVIDSNERLITREFVPYQNNVSKLDWLFEMDYVEIT